MIRRLFWGCWWRHGDLFRERDDQDRPILVCQTCGARIDVLPEREIFKGPQFQQKRDGGTVHTKAVKVTQFDQERKRA